MSSLDPISIQKNEIKALRSIFDKEFKLFRPKNIKKKFEPPYLAILINVTQSSVTGKESVSLKINFECHHDYPLTSPKLSITDASSNLSQDILHELISHLNKKSLDLIGVPMIHSLVEEARDVLTSKYEKHKNEKNVNINEDDEILQTEAKQSQLKLELLRQRRNSARDEFKKERKFEKCFHTHQTNVGVIEFHCCGEKSPVQVYKGACEGVHRTKLLAPSLQMTINVFDAFNVSRGLAVKLNQISLTGLTSKRFDHLKSTWLPLLEEDFAMLCKLNHDNVLPYLGFQWHSHDKTVRKKKLVDLNIQYLTPNCGGMKLSALCDLDTRADSSDNASRVRLSIPKIRGYVKSAFDALLYLHEKNVTHIKLNPDSIVIDSEHRLRLSHYCIAKRFAELKENCPEEVSAEVGSVSASLKKGSKRHDLFKLSRLAKRLFFYGVSDADMDEADMPSDLIDFIAGLESNLSDMNQHPFLCPTNAIGKPDYSHELVDIKQDLSPWKRFEESSRIPKEFELICKLGEGAFGDVVKVRNIYDNQYYAIKRVRLNVIKKKAARTMKEVQLLSSLNHENIVRYYASWSEEIPIDESSLKSVTLTESSSTRNNTSKNQTILKPDNIDSELSDLQDVRKSILFRSSIKCDLMDNRSRHFDLESYSDSDSSSDSDSDSHLDQNSTKAGARLANGSPSDPIYFERSQVSEKVQSEMGYVNDAYIRSSHALKPKVEKYLMIQMELCEGPWNTLQKCIEDQKLYLNEKLIWRFIREIVSGLEHIHSKNMIHRDLKPNNIFIDHQKRVKIGDLGLAMNMTPKIADRVRQDNPERGSISNDIERGPVGTVMYICPEMTANNTYTNKADMYSLGIIVFEMCHPPFGTLSERYDVLGKLRLPKIEFPSDKYFKMNSMFVQLIAMLLNHDPTMRPTATELLQSNIIPPPEGQELELRKFLLDITKTSSSSLYKLMLNGLFSQLYSKKGGYELPLIYQSPFKQFMSNSKTRLARLLRHHSHHELDEGNYAFFTIKRLLCGLIQSVFVCHGAVEFAGPLLSPNLSKAESEQFRLLDAEGVVVTLPDNLRTNFANFLINNGITASKRYAIGPIFQQQEYRRDHPRELLEAAFDIVTDYSSLNKIVEVLHALHQIFSKVLNFEHVTLTLELNHTDIFAGVMTYFRIPPDQHCKVLASLLNQDCPDQDHLDSDEFRQRSNLNDNQLANLKLILRHRGRLDEYDKFLNIFRNKSPEIECCKSIISAFNELRTIETRLNNFPERCCFSVELRPGFVPANSIYRGLVFRMVLQMQERFFDFVKPTSGNKNINLTVRYLRNPKQVCTGGEYSDYLMKSQSLFAVTEGGDVSRYVSAVGASLDVSTLLQSVYSMYQISLSAADKDLHFEYLVNSALSVLVQYEEDSDKEIRDLLAKLWAVGVSAELYDKDDLAEEHVLNHKIRFFVKFLNRSIATVDNRIILVKKSDCKGLGLEQISGEDTRTTSRVVELILHHSRKQRDSLLARLEREQTFSFQKPMSNTSNSSLPENPGTDALDVKKAFNARSTDSPSARYIYRFVSARDSQTSSAPLVLSYFVETSKHVQSVSQKNPDIDAAQVQVVQRLNCVLTGMLKWCQGRFPNPLYCIVAELSFSKCQVLAEEASVRALKDQGQLKRVFARIESARNYLSNSEKQWKDVLSRIWEALQDAVKEKISRVLLFSLIEENVVFLDIK